MIMPALAESAARMFASVIMIVIVVMMFMIGVIVGMDMRI
jgi:hypothetical protein